MYKDIFRKKKKITRRIAVLLSLLAILVVVLVIEVATIWWWQPIVIVRIYEFSLTEEVEELNLKRQMKNPALAESAPKIHGSLFIRIENIGRTTAENIALNFSLQHCKLGKLQIYKTDANCLLNITQPKELELNSRLDAKGVGTQDLGYFISIRELRPGSGIQLKYIIYIEGIGEPVIKFGKISSSNARVQIFYYRQ